MPRRIPALEQLARDLVGDDKTPDLFFVTDRGIVVTVSRDSAIAYSHWRALAARLPLQECALENRGYGVICSVEPRDDEKGAPLVRHDDYDPKRF